ncbi:unnamed protein product [Dicrocoelium dendriticum]|nr:unnamed protein product [Dicrocoelium dendriticum]
MDLIACHQNFYNSTSLSLSLLCLPIRNDHTVDHDTNSDLIRCVNGDRPLTDSGKSTAKGASYTRVGTPVKTRSSVEKSKNRSMRTKKRSTRSPDRGLSSEMVERNSTNGANVVCALKPPSEALMYRHVQPSHHDTTGSQSSVTSTVVSGFSQLHHKPHPSSVEAKDLPVQTNQMRSGWIAQQQPPRVEVKPRGSISSLSWYGSNSIAKRASANFESNALQLQANPSCVQRSTLDCLRRQNSRTEVAGEIGPKCDERTQIASENLLNPARCTTSLSYGRINENGSFNANGYTNHCMQTKCQISQAASQNGAIAQKRYLASAMGDYDRGAAPRRLKEVGGKPNSQLLQSNQMTSKVTEGGRYFTASKERASLRTLCVNGVDRTFEGTSSVQVASTNMTLHRCSEQSTHPEVTNGITTHPRVQQPGSNIVKQSATDNRIYAKPVDHHAESSVSGTSASLKYVSHPKAPTPVHTLNTMSTSANGFYELKPAHALRAQPTISRFHSTKTLGQSQHELQRRTDVVDRNALNAHIKTFKPLNDYNYVQGKTRTSTEQATNCRNYLVRSPIKQRVDEPHQATTVGWSGMNFVPTRSVFKESDSGKVLEKPPIKTKSSMNPAFLNPPQSSYLNPTKMTYTQESHPWKLERASPEKHCIRPIRNSDSYAPTIAGPVEIPLRCSRSLLGGPTQHGYRQSLGSVKSSNLSLHRSKIGIDREPTPANL